MVDIWFDVLELLKCFFVELLISLRVVDEIIPFELEKRSTADEDVEATLDE